MYKIHTHSDFSNLRLLDSINTIENMIKRCRDIGAKGFILTDHEAVCGHIDANILAKKNPDIKIGLGNEIYLVNQREAGQKYYHYILVAKKEQGHKAIRELSSNSWLKSYSDRGVQRVPTLKEELEEIVKKYPDSLIATSACLGGEVSSLVQDLIKIRLSGDKVAEAECYKSINDFLDWNVKLFGDDFYLECAPNDMEPQISVNKILKAISQSKGIKMVYGDDAHFLKKEDAVIHKAYLNSKGGDRETEQFYKTAYFQEKYEVYDYLSSCYEESFIDELFKNNEELFSKIEDYSLLKPQKVPHIKIKDYPKSEFSDKYESLQKVFMSDNIQERYWGNECITALKLEKEKYTHEYLDRLNTEAHVLLHIGNELNVCLFAYLNTFQHYIDIFWDCGSIVGPGRGSATGFLSNYLMGITQLDPVEWGLQYWRFLNLERPELPDIDIDLAPSKRPAIFKKIREERGDLGIVQVCTFGTEGTRSTIKTACRGYSTEKFPNGVDVDVATYMSSLVPVHRGFAWSLSDMYSGNEEEDRKPVKDFVKEVNKYPGLFDIMQKIEGLVNNRSVHASGVILYDEDIYDTAALMLTSNGELVTQYALHQAEAAGDIKYDFLATKISDKIISTLELLVKDKEVPDLSLKALYDTYLHPRVLSTKEQVLWDALSEGKVLDVFQFSTGVGLSIAKKLRPQNPIELTACNALNNMGAKHFSS